MKTFEPANGMWMELHFNHKLIYPAPKGSQDYRVDWWDRVKSWLQSDVCSWGEYRVDWAGAIECGHVLGIEKIDHIYYFMDSHMAARFNAIRGDELLAKLTWGGQ
jgi:hypothetical protein